jgi:hypothetical protein
VSIRGCLILKQQAYKNFSLSLLYRYEQVPAEIQQIDAGLNSESDCKRTRALLSDLIALQIKTGCSEWVFAIVSRSPDRSCGG